MVTILILPVLSRRRPANNRIRSVNCRYYILCDNREFIPADNGPNGTQSKYPMNLYLLRFLQKKGTEKPPPGFFPRRETRTREKTQIRLIFFILCCN